MIINFRILLPTKIRFTNEINAANYFKSQRRPSIRYAAVCFEEHPPVVKKELAIKQHYMTFHPKCSSLKTPAINLFLQTFIKKNEPITVRLYN